MTKQYYYHKKSEQVGPLNLDELLKAPLEPDTLVWKEGLPSWKLARDFPELSVLFTAETSHQSEPPQVPLSSQQSAPRDPVDEPLVALIPPPNYLAWAIVVTILCCWPLGIPAIVCATRVSKYFAMKDYTNAQRYSKLARNWTIAAAITGFVLSVLWIILLSLHVFPTIIEGNSDFDFFDYDIL